LTAALFAGRLALGSSAVEVARAALAVRSSPQPPRAWDLLLDGLALQITGGPSSGTPVLKRAVSAFREEEVATEDVMRWLWLAGRAAGFIWDYDGWDALTARQLKAARDVGALGVLPLTLGTRASVHLFAGELADAASLFEESAALAAATGSRTVEYGALARGELDEFNRKGYAIGGPMLFPGNRVGRKGLSAVGNRAKRSSAPRESGLREPLMRRRGGVPRLAGSDDVRVERLSRGAGGNERRPRLDWWGPLPTARCWDRASVAQAP
jgi:hypothetical protein